MTYYTENLQEWTHIWVSSHLLDEGVLSDRPPSLKHFYIFCLLDQFSSESTGGLVFCTANPAASFNDSITIHGYSRPKRGPVCLPQYLLINGPLAAARLLAVCLWAVLLYTYAGLLLWYKNQPHIQSGESHSLTKDQRSPKNTNQRAKHKPRA